MGDSGRKLYHVFRSCTTGCTEYRFFKETRQIGRAAAYTGRTFPVALLWATFPFPRCLFLQWISAFLSWQCTLLWKRWVRRTLQILYLPSRYTTNVRWKKQMTALAV